MLKVPSMILFDYGQTLINEPVFDGLKGTQKIMEYAIKNKYGTTPEEVQKRAEEINMDLGRFDPQKRHLFQIEIDNVHFNRYLYESMGIELSISYEEAGKLFWDAAAPGFPTRGIEECLTYLDKKGIRTGVLSNIAFNGNQLKERIDETLSGHKFEFILSTCDYVFRKPNEKIFSLALEKADLSPEDVWFVGDQYKCDIVGARNAGMLPIWYVGALDFEQDITKECITIKDWDELMEMIP